MGQIMYAAIGIIQFLLGLRLVLVLLEANPSAQFVAWVYSITDTLAGPFLGAFPILNLGGFMIEISIIFAMIGYAIIGWLIMRVVSLITASLYRTR